MKHLILLVSAMASLTASALTDVERKHIFERKRIIAQTVVSNLVITTYTQRGKEWTTTNVVQYVNAPVEAPIKYSKLKLIVAAKEAGKWDTLKAAISSLGMEDEWLACQFISSDNPAYISATNAVITRGIATEAEVKAFMKKAED